MGDKVGLSLIHCYLGLLALSQNRFQASRAYFVEGLTILPQTENKVYTVYNLIGMAGVLIAEGKPVDCVSLLAGATAIAESIGLKIEPEIQEPYEKAFMEAIQTLSKPEYQAAWEAGKRMDLEQTVQFALEN
jgi:hypothetical protein